ncbi:hypothetical protein [Olivibacter sitiensis]|uniref:hypothetical protein n=1 Tax=Olivibacter sitiensis TaxID=376470 RepID=UPI00042A7E19|nr:hypothetical protein [Olivibacter sitiensis]
MKYYCFLLVLIGIGWSSCSKKEDEPTPEQDPLIGMWHLRAVQRADGTFDVTNQDCFKDTYFDVKESEFTLHASFPNEEQEGSCQSQTQTANWVNENGAYYLVQNGQRQSAGITLNDNNETLQVNITADGVPVVLIFRR